MKIHCLFDRCEVLPGKRNSAAPSENFMGEDECGSSEVAPLLATVMDEDVVDYDSVKEAAVEDADYHRLSQSKDR